MASFGDYESYDGLELAELIRKREVTAQELYEAAIERIEERNPKINAVINTMFEQGKESIVDLDTNRPFAGVPFLLKDLLASYEGVTLSSGCKAFKDYVPAHDAEIVKRFKKSGVLMPWVTVKKSLSPLFPQITPPQIFKDEISL